MEEKKKKVSSKTVKSKKDSASKSKTKKTSVSSKQSTKKNASAKSKSTPKKKTSKTTNSVKDKKYEVSINEFLEKKEKIKKNKSVETFVKPNLWECIKNISKKRKILIASIIFIVLFLICLFSFIDILKNKETNELLVISNDKYKNIISSSEYQYIYLSDKSLGDNNTIESNLNKLESNLNITIYKLDNLLNYKNPTLIITKDNEVVNSISASKEYNVLKKFLTDVSSESIFNEITVDKYLDLTNNSTLTLIYIGNSYCDDFYQLLGTAVKDKKIDVYYLNLDNISDGSDWEKLNNSYSIFNDLWFTPVLMLVKNGKIVDYKMEKMSIDGINEFLNKNGVN